jgi:hypothetical protein
MIKLPFNIPGTKPARWPVGEFRDRLDALIVAAQKAGITSSDIASAFEAEAQLIRTAAVRSVNFSVVPVKYSAEFPNRRVA